LDNDERALTGKQLQKNLESEIPEANESLRTMILSTFEKAAEDFLPSQYMCRIHLQEVLPTVLKSSQTLGSYAIFFSTSFCYALLLQPLLNAIPILMRIRVVTCYLRRVPVVNYLVHPIVYVLEMAFGLEDDHWIVGCNEPGNLHVSVLSFPIFLIRIVRWLIEVVLQIVTLFYGYIKWLGLSSWDVARPIFWVWIWARAMKAQVEEAKAHKALTFHELFTGMKGKKRECMLWSLVIFACYELDYQLLRTLSSGSDKASFLMFKLCWDLINWMLEWICDFGFSLVIAMYVDKIAQGLEDILQPKLLMVSMALRARLPCDGEVSPT